MQPSVPHEWASFVAFLVQPEGKHFFLLYMHTETHREWFTNMFDHGGFGAASEPVPVVRIISLLVFFFILITGMFFFSWLLMAV